MDAGQPWGWRQPWEWRLLGQIPISRGCGPDLGHSWALGLAPAKSTDPRIPISLARAYPGARENTSLALWQAPVQS